MNGTLDYAAQFEVAKREINDGWILLCAFMVLTMQLGFTLVEAGYVVSNLRSIVMKNVIDLLLSCFSWYLIGGGIAHGMLSMIVGLVFRQRTMHTL